MDVLRISGGKALCGTAAVSGAKNAALPIMAASILAEGPVYLERVPDVTDVRTLGHVLCRLGLKVARQSRSVMRIEAIDQTPFRADCKLVHHLRGSFCVLGPLLARRGRAVVGLPGGCHIGTRPVDLHLSGLAALGAELRVEHGKVVATARRLRGTRVHLSGPQGPTVTGTANVLSAAVLARGVTIITGAAAEPEIVDLGNFLCAMGARIEGLGTARLVVTGVERLAGARHAIIPDRIEAATLLTAGAVTGGQITVTDLAAEHLGAVLAALDGAGAALEVQPTRIVLRGTMPPRGQDISALPYPGLPTDMQPQLTALMTVASSTSMIRDHVFPNRFLHVGALVRLGADICRCRCGVLVRGVKRLSGTEVWARDLRASAALVLAGLAADGETLVRHVHHLDRGYEHLDAKLRRLGAHIERLPSPTPHARTQRPVRQACR